MKKESIINETKKKNCKGKRLTCKVYVRNKAAVKEMSGSGTEKVIS